MKLGNRSSWTKEREDALLTLGEVAKEVGSRKKKNWSKARDLCPKESKILKDFTDEQLRKTYTRIVKSKNGICARSKCLEFIEDNGRYCLYHRSLGAERALKSWNSKGKFKRIGNI